MEEPPAAYAIPVGASVSRGREFAEGSFESDLFSTFGMGLCSWPLVCVLTVELACHSSFKHLCFCLVPIFWWLGVLFYFMFMYRCTCTCVYIHMCISR